MKWNNYFRRLELKYNIEINKNLRKAIEEYFGDSLNIYTEQDMYNEHNNHTQHKYFK